MKLLMPENQILQSYKYAVNKREQVGILADLNCCTKQEMAQWLVDHGEHVDKRFFAQGRQKNTPLKKGLERAEKEKREMETKKVTESVSEEPKVTEPVNTGSNIPEPTTIPEVPRRVGVEAELEQAVPELSKYIATSPAIVEYAPAPEPSQTAKADAGKPRLTLVPMQMMFDVAEVREYGCRKYPNGGVDNWKKVEPQRYREAAFRHFLRYLDDPHGKDEESGIEHFKHLECNIAFLAEMEKEQ